MKTSAIILTAITTFALLACQSKDGDQSAANSKGPSPELKAIIDASVDGEAENISTIRETAKPGDTITVKGWVMGNMSPFVEGRAAFVLGDSTVITACSERPGDSCDTPWDTCCDDPKDIQRATATIQIVGEDGRVLKEGIEGVEGINKLSKLLVAGTVAEGSTSENLVINASAIDLQ